MRTLIIEDEYVEEDLHRVCDLVIECQPGESVTIEFTQGLPEQRDLDFLAMGAFFACGRLVHPSVKKNQLILTVE